jgi:circadian clock protein KaiC
VTTRTLRLHLEGTGNSRFDAILGGGIPGQSVVVVAGAPGAGKTVFTLQLLFQAARDGKTCLYVTTLSEPAIKLIRYMQFFDFFDGDLLDRRIILADIGAAVRDSPERTMAELSRLVQQHEPSVIAIDSFKAVADLMPDARVARAFAYELATQTATWGATTFLLGEYTPEEVLGRAEFAVADGVIQLGTERRDLTSLREVEVLKLRGMAYVSGRHFFEIDQRGFLVYPRVKSPDASVDDDRPPAPVVRLSTGIRGLDRLFGGGIPRLSNTLVQGATGTGKTLLSLQFLIAGARKRERGVLFTLEETADQLRGVAASIGWDLRALERKGLLSIRYASPVELSTDRYLQSARDHVEQENIRRAVFDSLTSLALGVPSERRFKELAYSIGKHMRACGVTLLTTLEAEQLLGAEQFSGRGASFIADNVIRLRYIERAGGLARGISVLKARGVRHLTEIRRFTIGAGGLRVGQAASRNVGVLSGRQRPDRRRG